MSIISSLQNIKGCKLSNTLTAISDSAFAYHYDLTSIKIPDSIISIGKNAFDSCSSLNSIEITENSKITTLGTGCFSYLSNVSSINIPAGVTIIPAECFAQLT